METIIVKCPVCKNSGRVSTEFIGKQMRCKQCGNVFLIKSEDEPINTPPPQPSVATPQTVGLQQQVGNTAQPPPSAVTLQEKQEGKTAKRLPFVCLNCNHSFEVEEAWIGKQVECPNCKKTITICQPTTNATSLDSVLPKGKWKQRDVEKVAPTPLITKIAIFALFLFGIGIFVSYHFTHKPEIWSIFIGLTVIMAILCAFLPKEGLKFHLLEGERLLAECNWVESENSPEKTPLFFFPSLLNSKEVYFIRLTNLRMVLSSKGITSSTGVGKPAHIDYEWERADIKSFTEEKGSMMSKDKLTIELNDPSRPVTSQKNKFVFTGGNEIGTIVLWLKGEFK